MAVGGSEPVFAVCSVYVDKARVGVEVSAAVLAIFKAPQAHYAGCDKILCALFGRLVADGSAGLSASEHRPQRFSAAYLAVYFVQTGWGAKRSLDAARRIAGSRRRVFFLELPAVEQIEPLARNRHVN